jgi:endonuclease/exonuclease/phosphatase family metal-dependent hydrolase
MRVMTLNAYEGAQDSARYNRIKKLVNHHQVDVLCLQEANGWHEGSPSRLQDFAEGTKLTEVAFGDSNTASKLAIFSRFKILGFVVHKDELFHCAIQAWIESDKGLVEVVNVHNNPFDEDKRTREIAALTPHIGEDAIWFGDFNSFSRLDNYPPSLWKTLVDLENEKYGANELLYEVTDMMALHGFIDVAAAHNANVPTFPAMTGMEAFQHPARFDYVFAKRTAAQAIENIQVITDPLTTRTSDHRPLLVDIAESELFMPRITPITIEPSRALQFAA